jgi:hypothetical protein
MSGADAPAPFRVAFDNARDPYTARNALGITSTGGGGGAPPDAQYITAAADPTLTNEMVLTDTATVTWDFSTPGQAKANATGGGGGGGNVSNSGIPVGGQYAKWVTSTTIQGVSPATVLSDIGAAPVASPTFTGDPKAPTPTAGDNDTSIATTAFVTAADNAVKTQLIGSASSGFDTLGEIENYIAANITPALGNKADNSLSFITSAAEVTLVNERVLTDTATVTWDRTTAGQIKANAAGGGTPGGSNTHVQYNNSGAFGGSANFAWNNGTSVLTLTGQITIVAGSATSISADGIVHASAFRTFGTNASLGPITAGNVTLRPNGVASATGQLLVASSGAVTVAGPVNLPADPTTALQAATKQMVDAKAPLAAEYITSTADATLTAERVLTDTATVTWDRTTAGQIKANASVGGGSGVTVAVQKFTASGTYTPMSGMTYAIIECIGGGGGGGGANASANQIVAAGGGGAGAYSRRLVTAALVGASQTVTVGTGGNGGTATPGAGGTGNDTSVGTLCVAKGGAGAQAAANGATVAGGLGGAGASGTGDITASGAPGGTGIYSADALAQGGAGVGGSSHFGGGGRSTGDFSVGVVGVAATNYGSGGSGASSYNLVGKAGGAGSAGLVIITEYK